MSNQSKHTPLTLGIIGAANIARQFVTAVQATRAVKVTAVASRTAESAQAFADSYGIAKRYASYEALLDDASIEAVYIPLPNHLHAEWAIKAAQRGKHVLCEKPLCLGLAQAQAMFAAAERHGVVLLEAYPYWFQPQTREMLHLLHSGVIGQVRTMQASFGFTISQPVGNIRLSPEKGGGALLDAGSYPLSLVRLVMGEAPVRVHATPVWTEGGPGNGVDISMMATLEFANQRSAQISCAMNVANHRRATLMGTQGTIETEYLNHTGPIVTSQLRVRRGIANTIPFEEVSAAMGSGFRFAAEAFADIVRRRDFAAVARAKQASLDIAQTLEAIARSARTGKIEKLSIQPSLQGLG
ncbi:MAG: Gfo/Idh/MocA family oxidoreductase [Burkholderiaceae bacterium]